MTNAEARKELFDMVTEADTPDALILFAAIVGGIIEARSQEYSREQFEAVFEYLNNQPEATAKAAASFVQRHFLRGGVRA